MIAIRRAGVADAGKLAMIGAASFLESFAEDHPGDEVVRFVQREHSVAAYDAVLADPSVAVWIVEERAGAPIGYAMLAPASLSGTDPATDSELKRIYVFSRWHGGGLGKRLYDSIENEARQRGSARLVLGVYANNAKAIRFYTARGFEQVGTTTFADFGQAFVDNIMVKRL